MSAASNDNDGVPPKKGKRKNIYGDIRLENVLQLMVS